MINSPEADGAVFAIRLDARADHLMLVRQAIEGAVEPLGAGPALINDIKLAVTEACSNVVKYAYADADGTGPMHVTLSRLESGDLEIVVRDFGKWMDRNGAPAEEISGMGIPLIESVSTERDIARRDDGTEVRMVFALNGGNKVNA
jgi:serine/threonine-protein kinase RsbW